MKTVKVFVSGGIVQDVEVPEGVQVIVRDYDCDDEEDATGQDDDGFFIEDTHRHPSELFQPGESVEVEHGANDQFNHDFSGTVVQQKDTIVTVRDGDGDCWDVSVDQIFLSKE